jgi:hypothetical protein
MTSQPPEDDEDDDDDCSLDAAPSRAPRSPLIAGTRWLLTPLSTVWMSCASERHVSNRRLQTYAP